MMFFLEDSLVVRDEGLHTARLPMCMEDEFDVYVLSKSQEGKAIKEVPVDMHNHGMDAMRYFVAEIDNIRELDQVFLPMPSVPVMGASRFDRKKESSGKRERKKRRSKLMELSGKVR